MNATDIHLMEAPDAVAVRDQYRADEIARDRSWDASARVLRWSYEEADPDARHQLSGLASDLEDLDGESDVAALLRHAVAELSFYGERHQDVVEQILRPIVRECEGVR